MKHPARPLKKQQTVAPDPYDGSNRRTIPMPISVEHDSDSVWQDFKDTEAKLDTQFASTDFIEIEEKDQKP
jgi:hypothetical protein